MSPNSWLGIFARTRPPVARGTATSATLLADVPISCEGVAPPMLKIDVFNHIFPEQYVTRMGEVAPGLKDAGKRVRGVPMLVDLDVRFRVMDLFEDYQQILSIAT